MLHIFMHVIYRGGYRPIYSFEAICIGYNQKSSPAGSFRNKGEVLIRMGVKVHYSNYVPDVLKQLLLNIGQIIYLTLAHY